MEIFDPMKEYREELAQFHERIRELQGKSSMQAGEQFGDERRLCEVTANALQLVGDLLESLRYPSRPDLAVIIQLEEMVEEYGSAKRNR